MPKLLPPILLLLVVVPAHAQRLTLDHADKQLSVMEYNSAVEAAKAVVERGDNSLADLTRAYTIMAHALAVLGQEDAAKYYYTRLLVMDPKFELDKNVSPKVRAPLVAARSDRAGRPGLTAVHRPPPSASPDEALNLRIQVIEDPLDMVRGASVSYRLPGRDKPSTLGVGGDEKELVLAIPLPLLKAKAGTLTYDVNLLDVHNNVVWTRGPLEVQLGADGGGAAAGTGAAAGETETVVAGTPWYKRWWVWAIAGVVVAGAATAAVVVTTQPHESDVAMGWEVQQP